MPCQHVVRCKELRQQLVAVLTRSDVCRLSWELYGVTDEDHFPSSGSRYDIEITTGKIAYVLSQQHQYLVTFNDCAVGCLFAQTNPTRSTG